MAKQAFIVLGPEGSGNRYVTECFLKAGCFGDPGHDQRLDHDFECAKDAQKIVIRRSMPHGHEYPKLHDLTERIRQAGFMDIRVIVLVRNQICNVFSMVYGKETHARTEDEAKWKIVTAMRKISEFLVESKLPFHYMTYETIIHETDAFTNLLREWGLDASHIDRPRNENKKWIEDPPEQRKP